MSPIMTRRRLLQSTVGLGAYAIAGAAFAAAPDPFMVREDNIVGRFHPVAGRKRRTTVIMLNGSDGGIPSAAFAGDLAAAGFPTLALAYVQDDEGQPAGVPNGAPIPLEYFFRALEWLKRRPEVDPARIVVMGLSRGAELALLLASQRRDIRGVIAFSPASHVWGAPADLYRGTKFDRAFWSLDGRPLPFQVNRPDFNVPVRQWFAKAPIVDAAAIRVEDIAGPTLLLSSTSDGEWPASDYANEIAARLKAKNFSYQVINRQYDDASHLLMGYGSAPTKLKVPGTSYVIDFGGSPEGTRRARDAAWATSKSFLRKLR